MNKLIIIVLIGALLAGCTQQPEASITHVYAFGDDFSDNGKCAKFVEEAVGKGQLEEEFKQWLRTTGKGG